MTLLLLLALACQAAEPSPAKKELLPAGPALKLPACVRKLKPGIREPKTFDALMDCQFAKRKDFIEALKASRKRGPTAEEYDRFDDFQRKEARDYLKRHPAEPAPAEKPAAKASTEQSLSAIQEFMERKSENGRKGITPEIAQALTDYLKAAQGGVSPEMASLLEDLSQDGPRLRHKTMYKLKRAAREADAEGVSFKDIDPELIKWLVDPATDPDPDEPGPDYDQFQPPSM